jgi:hypothetical protein
MELESMEDVKLWVSDEELLLIAKAAHRADMTINNWCKLAIEETLRGDMGFALPTDCTRCFITGKVIPADVVDLGIARFTHEFGAWISKEGQRMLREEADSEGAMCDEWEIIWDEWNNPHEETTEMEITER